MPTDSKPETKGLAVHGLRRRPVQLSMSILKVIMGAGGLIVGVSESIETSLGYTLEYSRQKLYKVYLSKDAVCLAKRSA